LIDENFSGAVENWQVVAGEFAAEGGTYSQADQRASPALSLFEKPIDAASVTYSLRAKKTGGREGFLVVFGSRESDRYYWWNIGGWGNTRHAIEKGGGSYLEGKSELVSKQGSIQENVWHDIRIELAGNRIRCFLNDELIHDVRPAQPRIGVAASRADASGDVILKIANPRSEAYPTRIHLPGIDNVKSTGTVTLLTGGKEDANDVTHPDKVKPAVSRIPVDNSFDYTIPPMSVQFIRISLDSK